MSSVRRSVAGLCLAVIVALGSGLGVNRSALAAGDSPKVARSPLGTWQWFNGQTVEFKANGTTEAANGMKGRWTGGNAVQNVIVKWDNGAVDTLAFTPDNLRLYNVNTSQADILGERIVPVAGSTEAAAIPSPSPKPSVGGTINKATEATTPPVRVDAPPIGQWHWFNDQTVTFRRTGEVEASGGWRGKWYVSVTSNREVAILWDGNPPDVVTLSPDGKHLAGGFVSAEWIGADSGRSAATPRPTVASKGGGYFGTQQ